MNQMTTRKRRKNACQLLIPPIEHLQPQVPLPSPGTPAPGRRRPFFFRLGDVMRGMAGTWVYANRNEFDADDWF